MDITALFDNADAAQHALVNLQALGIFPARYKIKALHITEGAARGSGVVSGNANNSVWNVGFPDGSITGVINADGVSDTAFSGREGPSQEVQLLVTVGAPEAHRTQSALISNQARRVRMT